MISSVGSTPFPILPSGDPSTKPATGSPDAVIRATAATAQRSVDGQLQLTTKEGDTVTISAHADASVTYARAFGRSADGRFSARSVSLEAHQDFSIQVQGNLSEQEMAEINKVVKSFFHELRDAFRGRGSDVGEIGQAGDGATTLANFAVHIDTSSSVSVVSLVARPKPGPAPVPVQPLPQGGEAAPATAANDGDADDGAPASAPAVPGTDISALARRLVSVARSAEVAAHRLGSVLDGVFRQFGRQLPTDGARAVLAALQQSVQQGLSEPAPADTASTDIPAGPPPAA
jgi:hypothetical protein